MRARGAGSIAALLDDIHAVLMPLKQPQMFVTVACVRGGCGDQVECAVAGHLPILRARNGRVEEVTSPQIAVGMLDGTTFSSAHAECLPGDLFALLTDGLIEVFDRDRTSWASTGRRAYCSRAMVSRCRRSAIGCSRALAHAAPNSTIKRFC